MGSRGRNISDRRTIAQDGNDAVVSQLVDALSPARFGLATQSNTYGFDGTNWRRVSAKPNTVGPVTGDTHLYTMAAVVGRSFAGGYTRGFVDLPGDNFTNFTLFASSMQFGRKGETALWDPLRTHLFEQRTYIAVPGTGTNFDTVTGLRDFVMMVTGDGGNPFTVVLETSLDNATWTVIATLTNVVPGPGVMQWALNFPTRYVRQRATVGPAGLVGWLFGIP